MKSKLLKAIVVCFILLTTFSLAPSNLSEAECLARNMYYEARGEGVNGMLAVGQVSINRTKDYRFPSSLCSVVFQRSQFSWTGKMQKPPVGESWDTAKMLASDMVYGKAEVIGLTATYYHNNKVKPIWRKKMHKVAIIGNHIFYRDKNAETTKTYPA